MTKSERAREFSANVERYFKTKASLSLEGEGTKDMATWFLGPKAENRAEMAELLMMAFDSHCQDRLDYCPGDPVYVTDEMKSSLDYKLAMEAFKGHLNDMLRELRGSIPLSSYRNQSHMYWDITMPGAVGYFAAMLYNQNNVATEASPVTTYLEMLVGDDLCEMLGYHVPDEKEIAKGAIKPWGHITCDGSVANTEAMWSSRNLKFMPVTIARALANEPSLGPARGLEVRMPNGRESRPLLDLDSWELLNLRVDDVLLLSPHIQKQFNIDSDTLQSALSSYNVQYIGMAEFYRRLLPDLSPEQPAIMAPATMHYSWPKAAALLGIGQSCVRHIPVDLDCRMNTSELRKQLDECLEKKIPVMQVVAVMGTTEESAVDPLDEIVAIRDEYRQAGLDFELHLDAAWGGYFASMIRKETRDTSDSAAGLEGTPAMCMGEYVRRQYEAFPSADSITVDPHKAGFIPYPAGALCYRNGAQRDLVAFTAPVVYHGGVDPTVGVYGVEGSKPGAAAAGVYLSHRVIRTDRSGYGNILGKCTWNSKRLYAEVLTLEHRNPDVPFIVKCVQRPPAERNGASETDIKKQIEFIGREIVPRSNDELVELFAEDEEAWKLFREMGSDQIIISYSFNFKLPDGTLNNDIELCNALNKDIFNRLSLQQFDTKTTGQVPDKPMFVTQSDFSEDGYGEYFVKHYANRLGLQWRSGASVAFIISTTQDPWVTNTAEGNFIPTIGKVLKDTVTDAVHTLWRDHSLA
jgi:glutamate/tyrosine decarboxylase-like PLP-dependent enzyme